MSLVGQWDLPAHFSVPAHFPVKGTGTTVAISLCMLALFLRCSFLVRDGKNRHTGSADQCQNLSAESSESKSHIESRRLKQSLCRHGAQRHPCAGEHRCFDGDGVPG